MIRPIVLASVSVIALTAAASAADLYGPGPVGPDDYRGGPIYAPTWAGFYAGINGGGGWSEGHDLIFSSPSFPGIWGTQANLTAVAGLVALRLVTTGKADYLAHVWFSASRRISKARLSTVRFPGRLTTSVRPYSMESRISTTLGRCVGALDTRSITC